MGKDQFAQLKQQFEQQQAAAGNASTGTFQEQCSTAIKQAGGDPSGCDIDFTTWITNLSNDGDADVGGTPTTHISGDVDTQQMLSDIGNLASSIPGASSQGFDPSQLSAISGAITDASIDVYSGTDDNVLRKLDANLTIDPSAIAPAGAVPVSNIKVSFSVEIDGLNEQQTITAPSNPKPISAAVQRRRHRSERPRRPRRGRAGLLLGGSSSSGSGS